MSRGDLQIQDLRVIMMLARARGPVTTAQISERFDIPQRTVQRIIQAIEAIPLPIQRDKPGMGGGLRLQGDLALRVSLPSNLVELAALNVAREWMRESAGGTLLCEALEDFVDRTQAKMSPEQRVLSERFSKFYRKKGAKPRAAANPIATLVHKAIEAGQVLLIDYTSPNESKAKRRAIEPFGVWLTEGRSYVIGHDRSKDAVRTFALDRIKSAKLSTQRFTARDFDADAYFGKSIGAYVGAGPVALEISLDAEALRRLGSKLPNATARLKKDRLFYEAPLSDELLSWLVTLGPGARVVAPPAAVDFVRQGFAARIS